MRTPLRLVPFFIAAAACTTGNKSASDTTAVTNDTMATAAAPQDEGAAKDAIAKVRAAWMDAANRKDAAAVAAMYTDDAVMVGTDAPPASGRSEIQNGLGQMLPTSNIQSIDSRELVVSGDDAYDFGTYRQQMTPPTGPAKTINGYYLVTLKRQSDGSWKLYRHVNTIPPTKS